MKRGRIIINIKSSNIFETITKTEEVKKNANKSKYAKQKAKQISKAKKIISNNKNKMNVSIIQLNAENKLLLQQ